eukprot:7151367-Prymnesium_polylepis.2
MRLAASISAAHAPPPHTTARAPRAATSKSAWHRGVSAMSAALLDAARGRTHRHSRCGGRRAGQLHETIGGAKAPPPLAPSRWIGHRVGPHRSHSLSDLFHNRPAGSTMRKAAHDRGRGLTLGRLGGGYPNRVSRYAHRS